MLGTPLQDTRRPELASPKRRLQVGAEVVDTGLVHFCVWAPTSKRLEVVFDDGRLAELTAAPDGYFSGSAPGRAGDRYRFRLNGSGQLYPDPASRFQPEGPHGSSAIIDPTTFAWTDASWTGVRLEGQVLYELHVGTFTRDGTWAAASRELDRLAELGVTVVEVMPVAEFEGRFGWGYDGVDLFAPSHLYGSPDDFRRFVDRAHALGLGVLLDAVYNHLGPSGNYLRAFAPAYFTDRYKNEWGEAINFDGEDAKPVREFIVGNAGYWIEEFHLDGLRLDATQQIFDTSSENVLTAIARRVREKAGARSTIIVAENEPQDAALARSVDKGGRGLDGLWNEDFHHAAMVALTGRAEAYYSDTRGVPQEFISAAKYGYLFQGQHYDWQRNTRGTPGFDLEPAQFVNFLQNHDQVANSARGIRGHLLTSPGRWRAMSALLLLMPGTPMLFQGQEFSASTPFLYFADFEGDLAAAVRKGRAEFLMQFPSFVDFRSKSPLDDPCDVGTFGRSQLDFSERQSHVDAHTLHRDLLRLRRERAAFRSQSRGAVDGTVLGPRAFALRFFTEGWQEDRVLLVNLGRVLERRSFAEPLLAPPAGTDWQIEWSSDDPAYGGPGTADLRPQQQWLIPAECAIVLAPLRSVLPASEPGVEGP
jgi:maltooligosyltrehalose trehalohydrolase